MRVGFFCIITGFGFSIDMDVSEERAFPFSFQERGSN